MPKKNQAAVTLSRLGGRRARQVAHGGAHVRRAREARETGGHRALEEILAMRLVRTVCGERIVGREAIEAHVAGHKLAEDDVLLYASANGLVLKLRRDPVA
jgi:hypothetical protein